MANSYTLLANLRASRCSNTAEVRLLRFWEARNINKGGELMSIEMLLIDEALSTNCAWREVKRSMRFVYVILKPEYTAILKNNKPPLTCHKNDKDNICPSCFHYKMMRRFVGFVRQNI
ncbi:hypothetical protein IGI04_003099 [Brassica rapa subsp. trilocularis]|uniref:Uncharacterized protein n=1 Tax=Brassica rapa subsp. trilocularis TaxID=1813537 RepID=A0ABQ7NXG1_BRACM|nr:hypothetical protein IGI04_003099 [Brassica rapa subsp. trilocularis]